MQTGFFSWRSCHNSSITAKLLSATITRNRLGNQRRACKIVCSAHCVSFSLAPDMGRATGRLMSFVELARVKDSYDYMIKAYLGVRVKYPNTCASIIRNVKRA